MNNEEYLEENEIKYKTLFESANDAIFLLKNNLIIELNPKAIEVFGGTKENLLGKSPVDLSPEIQPNGESSNEIANEKLNLVLKGESQFFEWQHKRLNNSLFDAEVSLNLINFNNETVTLAIVRDISQRKNIEKELINSRRSMSNLLKNLPGVAYRCRNEKNWIMEYISEGCFSLTGYTHEQLLNNKKISYGDLILTEYRDIVWDEIQKALEKKESFKINYKIKTADGKIKWVWEQGSGIFSEDTEELLYIEGLINDITETKLTEEALKFSEAKFRSLVEESLVGVYIIQENKFSYVNPKFAEIFGYKPEEIILRKKVEDLVFEEDTEIVKGNINKRLARSIQTIHYTFRGLKKDRSIVEVEVMGSLTLFNGNPAIIGTIQDVTEKKRIDKEVKKLLRAVEQSPASIVITDINGNIEYTNSKFTEITGYTSEEVLGKNPKILKYGDTPKVFYENLWRTIKSGNEWRGEFLNRKKNGELFWEFASISPVKDNDGTIINFLAVKEDITARKNIDEELKIAKEKAEEMNRLKSVFLANMSHELRTPMVAVLGYSEILKNEIDNSELRELAKEIYESSHRFMNTLNLILDLSRIEANREVINLSEIDVTEIVVEEFEFFRVLANKKNLQLITDFPSEPIIALLDQRMLRQIISSLTSNAVKFTNKGRISLEIYKRSEDFNEYVIIKISDTGIGIPKNSQKIIFDAFRQISEGLNRTFEGAGLGLTVSKKFVEMMNGTITVDSEFGKGSIFTIKFPILEKSKVKPLILKSSEMKVSEEQKSNLPGILLVEDDQSNAGVIKFFLENICSIDTVLKGEDAVEKAAAKNYSAVLMDIDLGIGMSGLEAAKKIKKIPGYENTPIIAVTALAMRGDREKFLAEGCTHYISKPFKKEDLINIVKEAIGKS